LGSRDEDFRVAPAPRVHRGRRFEEQLALMRHIWAGEPVAEDVGPVGPPPARPGGPELLIGGYAPAAAGRVARWGDGYIAGGQGNLTGLNPMYRAVEAAWRAAGRPGRPRLVAAMFWALGPNAAERTAAYIQHYYGSQRGDTEARTRVTLSSPEAIRRAIAACADTGADELLLRPCAGDVEQLERLADVIG
jgi:alkanesulfonate monooxygenase SsuD/methylene tetrahydromethanopterin reductase-like flavin-dependent oxidoreductase (luciferase family)